MTQTSQTKSHVLRIRTLDEENEIGLGIINKQHSVILLEHNLRRQCFETVLSF